MSNKLMGTSLGKMIVLVWNDGSWCFGWDKVARNSLSRLYGDYKAIDLDNHLNMDLSALEIKACIEACDEAESSRSR